jgi:uncharacterized membrane protein SpoIIM required for sporulation
VLSGRWVEKRKDHWARLEALLAACGHAGVRRLTHSELQELALLYRQTAADLSAARADPSRATLASYLNQLLGRAHHLIYSGHRVRRRGVIHFYAYTFPQVFRETWGYTATAFLLFAVGALVGGLLVIADPSFERFVLGGEMLDTIERREMWTHSILGLQPLASAGIMTNNLSVSFAAYATGIFAGLGTGYVLLLNGMLISVIGAACHRADMSLSLWSFVAPHGVLELPAIFMAGGAGLVLARSVVMTGTRPRREEIASAGRLSIRLLLGIVPILVVAGLIEGFISPTATAPGLKFLFSAVVLLVFAAYLWIPGRGAPTA